MYSQSDPTGEPLYSGIRYVSRLNNEECWAIFDGTGVVLVDEQRISDQAELHDVMKDFGLLR